MDPVRNADVPLQKAWGNPRKQIQDLKKANNKYNIGKHYLNIRLTVSYFVRDGLSYYRGTRTD